MADATPTTDITGIADVPAPPEPRARERPARSVSGGPALPLGPAGIVGGVGPSGGGAGRPKQRPARQPRQRKQMLLRLDPAVHDAIARWAGDELRSTNAQIEFLLRKALAEAGRLPGAVRPIPRRGRPPRAPSEDTDEMPE